MRGSVRRVAHRRRRSRPGFPRRASWRWICCAARTTWPGAVAASRACLRGVALDQLQVEPLQPFHHGPTGCREFAAVDLGHGRDTGESPGDKGLVRAVDISQAEVLLDGGYAGLPAQGQDVGTRNAGYAVLAGRGPHLAA